MKVRVVHIITKLELGGAQQNTLYTVKHLNRNLFEPHLICGQGGILDRQAAELPDVNVHFCKELVRPISPASDWRAYERMKTLLRDLRPQIVHTHSSKAGILGRLAASAAKVPAVVHTYHGFGFHRFQNPLVFRAYLAAERYACGRTNHLVFVSRGNWQWAESLGLCRHPSAGLIHSGVEATGPMEGGARAAMRAELGIPPDAKLVGMIACLKQQKDPLTYVRAADIVRRKRKDVHFLLAGDGELREQVSKAVEASGDPAAFLMLGWRFDILRLLSALDLMVLTSRWEGLPRVIPEATISRVPVIASDIEGHREIVQDGKNGALAQPGNPEDFADKIVKALDNRWSVDAGYARQVGVDFDIRDMVTKQEQLYLNLLGLQTTV